MDERNDTATPATAGKAGAEGAGVAGGFNNDIEFGARVFEGGA